MTKTICDRCGKRIGFISRSIEIGTFKYRSIDLCRECYKEFLEWLEGGNK